jgi:hypothetical protein
METFANVDKYCVSRMIIYFSVKYIVHILTVYDIWKEISLCTEHCLKKCDAYMHTSIEVFSLNCPAICSGSPTTLLKKDRDIQRIKQDMAILALLS